MKRRGFLKTLAGLFAAPAVPTGAWASYGKLMVGGVAAGGMERTHILPMPCKPRASAFAAALRPGIERYFADSYRDIPDGFR